MGYKLEEQNGEVYTLTLLEKLRAVARTALAEQKEVKNLHIIPSNPYGCS
jgi:hypothetical protein